MKRQQKRKKRYENTLKRFLIVLGVALIILAIYLTGYLYAEELGWELGEERKIIGGNQRDTSQGASGGGSSEYQDPSIGNPENLGGEEEYEPPEPPANDSGAGVSGGGGGGGGVIDENGDGGDFTISEENQTNICGDGVVNTSLGEECDGSDLNGFTCLNVSGNFIGGNLSCASDCTFNITACILPEVNECGDGVVNGSAGEVCDPPGSVSLCTVGDYAGNQTCLSDCLDYSECNAIEFCGDGVQNGNEQCDGSDLNGQSCISNGYSSGTLSCSSSCTFITSSCKGDSSIQAVKDPKVSNLQVSEYNEEMQHDVQLSPAENLWKRIRIFFSDLFS